MPLPRLALPLTLLPHAAPLRCPPGSFKNGDVLSVCIDLGAGTLRFARNGIPLGEAFRGVTGPLVAVVTLASEESKVTIQNRPTVLNTGEYTGELRCAFCLGAGASGRLRA